MAQGQGKGTCRGNDTSATHNEAAERVCGREEKIGGISLYSNKLQSIPVKANERAANENRDPKK
jgi:hypothetical protein